MTKEAHPETTTGLLPITDPTETGLTGTGLIETGIIGRLGMIGGRMIGRGRLLMGILVMLVALVISQLRALLTTRAQTALATITGVMRIARNTLLQEPHLTTREATAVPERWIP